MGQGNLCRKVPANYVQKPVHGSFTLVLERAEALRKTKRYKWVRIHFLRTSTRNNQISHRCEYTNILTEKWLL